jgi:isopenicillin N synthase-like dioxygenase
VEKGNSVLRAIHYPPIRDRQTSAARAARHEDVNLITLLIGSNEARQARYSIPFFLHPNRYSKAVTANEFLVERLREIKLM